MDHRYYNPESSSWKSIDIEPGYQLMHGHDALDFVRFRHDQQGDFTRMQRQQLFLKELQRQSGRWSGDWSRVLRIIKALTAQTTSDIDSLRKLAPLVRLIFAVNTSNVNTVHVEGTTPTIDGRLLRRGVAGRDRPGRRRVHEPGEAEDQVQADPGSRRACTT